MFIMYYIQWRYCKDFSFIEIVKIKIKNNDK